MTRQLQEQRMKCVRFAIFAVALVLILVFLVACWRSMTLRQKRAEQRMQEDLESRESCIEDMIVTRVWQRRDGESASCFTLSSDDLPLGTSSQPTIGESLECSDECTKSDCLICLHPLEEGQSVAESKHNSCRHVFHAQCLKNWLLNSDCCPICRAKYFVQTS